MAGATNPREPPPCTENDHAPQPRRLADFAMTAAVAIRPAARDEIGAVLDVWRGARACRRGRTSAARQGSAADVGAGGEQRSARDDVLGSPDGHGIPARSGGETLCEDART